MVNFGDVKLTINSTNDRGSFVERAVKVEMTSPLKVELCDNLNITIKSMELLFKL